MKLTCSILILFFLQGFSLKVQSQYLAGTSSVSIEPDSSVFSLALAGYGAPREGRFSITWNYLNEANDITAITSLNGKLYVVTRSNELQEGKIANDKPTWSKIQDTDPITALTAFNGKLYAVKKDGLWSGILLRGKINWKKISGYTGITALTFLHNKLFAANSKNELLAGTFTTRGIAWTKTGMATGIVSMTSYNDKIFALNSGDTLWSVKPSFPNPVWVEIGRNNGATVSIDIKHIVVCNGKLYAVSDDNKLYKAAHKTAGNLTARSIAIKSKNKTVVITGMDVTGFNLSFINDIKSSIYKTRKIPASAILINASHTHFAPVTQAWTTWGDFYHVPDSNYLNKTVKKAVIKSIEQALDNMSPAEIYFGRGTSEIGLNRRGSATNYKPYDSTLDVLKITGVDKKIKSVLFLTACHPVFKNGGAEAYTLSANYPGVAKEKIEEAAHIPHSLFIQGCGGDINPKSDMHVATGQQLSDEVIKLLNADMEPLKGDISFAIDEIKIPVTPWSKDSVTAFRQTNAARPGDLSAEKNVRWADLMLDRYKKGTVASTLPVYVQTINIGDWKLVGLSREVVNEYGPAIRKIWTGKKVSVAGYCNDVASYLPIAWHITEKQYEGFDSFFWYGQPGIPPLNVLDIIVQKIKSFNR